MTQRYTHALERTSLKGQLFRGTCTKCGAEDLSLASMSQECPNTLGLSDDDALMHAIVGPQESPQ